MVLRWRERALERPFKVWGNTAVLAAVCALAVAIAIIAPFTNGGDWLIGGLAGVLTGPIAYLVFKPLCRPKQTGPARLRRPARRRADAGAPDGAGPLLSLLPRPR